MRWVIRSVGSRPWTINKVAQSHRMAWAARTKQVRTEWFYLGQKAGIQPISRAAITVTPLHKDGRSPQDPGACAPEAKAAVDGLIDAGLLVDDSAQYVIRKVFLPPLIAGVDGMEIEVVAA